MEATLAAALKRSAPSLRSLSLREAGAIAALLAENYFTEPNNENLESIAVTACQLAAQGASPLLTDTDDVDRLWALCALATHALGQLPVRSAAPLLRRTFVALYLPLLLPGVELQAAEVEAVRAAACDATATCHAWHLALELVSNSATSIEGHGVNRTDDDELYELSRSPAAIRLSADLADAALAAAVQAAAGPADGEGGTSPAIVLQHAARRSIADVLHQVAATASATNSSQTDSRTQALVRHMLPASLAAAEQVGQLRESVRLLWATCRQLGSSPSTSEHKTGVALLVQFCRFVINHSDAVADEQLWDILLRSLSSHQALDRKRAFFVLEAAIEAISSADVPRQHINGGAVAPHTQDQPTSTTGKQSFESTKHVCQAASNAATGVSGTSWSIFAKLYATAEETALHLFKEAWPAIDQLHPPMPMPATDIAQTTSIATISDAGRPDMATNAISGTPLALPLPWLLLLWRKALAPSHLTAQKHAMVSFLNRFWSNTLLAEIPPEFASSVLAPALGQPGMAKGEYSSEIQAAYPAFFKSWGASLGSSDKKIELLTELLSALANPNQQHAGMNFLATAVAAAAEGIGRTLPENEDVHGVLLQKCRAAVQRHHGYGSNAVVLYVYSSVAKVVTSCSRISSPRLLALLGHVVRSMPLALLQPGGSVHGVLAPWLAGAGSLNGGGDGGLTGCMRGLVKCSFSNAARCDTVDTCPIQECDADVLARLALLLETSLGLDGLNAAFQSWIEALHLNNGSDGVGSPAFDQGLPLLLSFIKGCTPLETTRGEPQVIKAWLRGLFGAEPGRATSFIALAERHSAWLLEIATSPHSLSDLAATCQRNCIALDHSPGSAKFTLEKTLSEEFKRARNAACNAIDCVAGLARIILFDPGETTSAIEHQERDPNSLSSSARVPFERRSARGRFAATMTRYMAQCADAYPKLWNDGALSTMASAPSSSPAFMLRLVRLEIGYCLLRPMAACGEALCIPRCASECSSLLPGLKERIATLLQSVCAVLRLQHERFANLKRAEQDARSGQSKTARKMRMKTAKPAVTLDTWHYVTAWRALDSLMTALLAPPSGSVDEEDGENGVSSTPHHIHNGGAVAIAAPLPIQLLAEVVGVSIQALKSASDCGLTPVISCIRCIRAVLPLLTQHPEPFTLAIASACGIATDIDRIDSTFCSVIALIGDTLLYTLLDQARNRTGLGAAVIATIMHPALFSTKDVDGSHKGMVAMLHQSDGSVLHGLLRRLVDVASTHARLMALVSAHVSGLFAAFPEFACMHADTLATICTFGVDNDADLAPLNDAVLDVASAREFAAVLPPLDASLESCYATSAAAPRVSALCLLHEWVQHAKMRSNATVVPPQDASVSSDAALLAVWHRLFDMAVNDEVLATENYMYYGPIHRKKIRAWQALALLCPIVPPQDATKTLRVVSDMLCRSNASTVKQFQEIVALQMLMLRPALLELEILPLIRDYTEQKVDAMPSLIALATHAALELRSVPMFDEASWRRLVEQVVLSIAPWTMSYVHGTRTFSQLLLWRLLELLPWIAEDNAILKAQLVFFLQNSDLRRLRMAFGVSRSLDGFSLETATSLKGILCVGVGLLGAPNAGPDAPPAAITPLETAPESLLDALIAYLREQRVLLRREFSAVMEKNEILETERRAVAAADVKRRLQQENAILGEAVGSCAIKKYDEEGATELENGKAGPRSDEPRSIANCSPRPTKRNEDWQRKILPTDKGSAVIDPWGAALALSTLVSCSSTRFQGKPNTLPLDTYEAAQERSAIRAALESRTAAGGTRQELIVVASLIDRIPNLAGLARTCEVFRAARLVLSDASVVKDADFCHISVSAEHWVPIEEVSRVSLASWLRQKAAEGYTLVGLEQTAGSVRLPEYVFPRRAVLLLGAEKEGVPADLLELLDVAVEIPQLGVVRSLNVHVSAACAIYEYTRQRRGFDASSP